MTIVDANARRQALDPSRSFIVQAPAGSGKTELLIGRYLALLSRVEAPEEIIAITFTRKAAAEMRRRILLALERGQNPDPPEQPHEQTTWRLARAALDQDRRRGWRLSQTPSRLKIQTIDALCAAITRQMPCLSGMGAPPRIAEHPWRLYRKAARQTVAELESGAPWSPAVEALVRHLDNDLPRIESLAAAMLSRRDQWLRHVGAAGTGAGLEGADALALRIALEGGLSSLIRDALSSLRERFPQEGRAVLCRSARYAAQNLNQVNADSPIRLLIDMTDLPDTGPEALGSWAGLAELLLTGNGDWRKAPNKNQGFPPPSEARDPEAKRRCKENKADFTAYLKTLETRDTLAGALHQARELPSPVYTEHQWDILKALFTILKVAAARLQLVFQEEGAADFTEIALRAAQALGGPENPTDLALSLDYRISHLLMDEFQDTSASQFDLLTRLTAGWSPGDGRTLFLVGDPMQSIYGFREAEVGLFLKAWENGLETADLTPLRLCVNFRSQRGIINWVNRAFLDIMPEAADKTTGGVPYTPSVAFHDLLPHEAVTFHPFSPVDPAAEAAAVADCIRAARQEDPEGTIAVLVRGRPHLASIVPALKQAGLSFQAVDIDPLESRPVILDLMALARALTHPADRIAWLAVLRAPWCGLGLEDLHLLVENGDGRTVLDLMDDADRVARLSDEGGRRLARVRAVMVPAVANRQRKSLRRAVEGAWLALGGPAAASSLSELGDADAFLSQLDALTADGKILDISDLEQAASSLFARPDPTADKCLQIMTIHKAKGLEFDTVIIPALDKKPPYESPQLLRVLERTPGEGEEMTLLVAPIAGAGMDKDPIYRHIEQIQGQKRTLEDARLLYVAVTRARKRLHLFGGVGKTADGAGLSKPPGKSLLSLLWPSVRDYFEGLGEMSTIAAKALENEGKPSEINTLPPVLVPCIRRFAAGWRVPDPGPEAAWPHGSADPAPTTRLIAPLPFDWAGEAVRLAGVSTHRWLKAVCEQGLANWDEAKVWKMEGVFRADLVRLGASGEILAAAVDLVREALINALTHDRGRWVLSSHAQGACEYALTGMTRDGVANVVMDRTFVDEAGVRWIIDYKTGAHRGGGVEEFLDREKERYETQLETYAALMRAREGRKIRMGLYFPMVRGWREWGSSK